MYGSVRCERVCRETAGLEKDRKVYEVRVDVLMPAVSLQQTTVKTGSNFKFFSGLCNFHDFLLSTNLPWVTHLHHRTVQFFAKDRFRNITLIHNDTS